MRFGPEFTLDYQDNETNQVNIPVKNYSPFVITIEPPLVLASTPITAPRKGVGIYEAALKGSNPYQSARSALQKQSLVGGSSAQEIIDRATSSPDGSKTEHNASRTGKPGLVDLYNALDISAQLKDILDTPPLVMLVNPNTLTVNYTKIQAFQDRTRHGYVFQAFGEEQPRLSISAQCGAFYSEKRGLHLASRQDSAAWQNIMTAYQFFRNNGYIFDSVGKSHANHLVGCLSISFDGWTYFGHMESFNWTDEEDKPNGGMRFDIEFVVSRAINKATDPNVRSEAAYGYPELTSDPIANTKVLPKDLDIPVLPNRRAAAEPDRKIRAEIAPAKVGRVGFQEGATATTTSIVTATRPQPYRLDTGEG